MDAFGFVLSATSFFGFFLSASVHVLYISFNDVYPVYPFVFYIS